MNKRFDVAILGSSFSGSILGWILASRGRRVALIDPVLHPRFAIGESSTPIADLLLRRLGQEYSLPTLEHLSTYGSWQRHYPDLGCGRKRGFSYFVHRPGQTFTDDEQNSNSLLVAASASNEAADTHWYRADVDQFLFKQAVNAGCHSFHGFADSVRVDELTEIVLEDGQSIKADWVIDATGRNAVLAKQTKKSSLVDQITDRHALRIWSLSWRAADQAISGRQEQQPKHGSV